MTKLKVHKVEEKQVMVKGQPQMIKKAEIQVEGKDWTYGKVTVWNDYPEYNGVVAGAIFDHSHIKSKEQEGTKNPKNDNKPYQEHTLTYGKYKAESTTSTPNETSSELMAKIDSIGRLLGEMYKELMPKGVEAIPYPAGDDEINPDEIPF